MKTRVKEESVRTIAIALVGFAALMIAVPDWARLGVAGFAVIYGGLAYLLDANVRGALRFGLDSRLHGNDRASAKSAPAKSPDARRAAT